MDRIWQRPQQVPSGNLPLSLQQNIQGCIGIVEI